MKRLISALLFTLTVLAPPASAQDRVPPRGASTASAATGAEAEVFLSALRDLSRMHMKAPSDSALWEAALDGMVKALGDPYAAVFTPTEAEAFEEETTGNYAGIGVQITPLNQRVTITAVFRGTPAQAVGLQVGDIIVGVDGDDSHDWTTDSAAVRIRGPVGTDVQLEIQRDGISSPIPFTITRDEVHIPAVNYGMLDDGIGYVILDRVARNAAREMDAALREMSDARGLIIDLRRNPGGYLDESLMLADIFLDPGSKLASTEQRTPGGSAEDVSTESWSDRFPARVPDLPIVVLVDRFTASGAEILAGALQDYDRAVVLGERSFGKGLVQTIMRLPYGRRLRFTTGTWHTPLGRSLHRPRDENGRPLPEDLDTLPRVSTAGGRALVDGGGIFPDLAIPDDTLRTAERELLQKSSEARVNLGLRIAEASFTEATARMDRGDPPGLTAENLTDLVARLREDGLDDQVLDDPAARDYLAWRVRMGVAQRMNDVGAEADVRVERDPVLAQAKKLLEESATQGDLFAAALRAGKAAGSTSGGS